jgi:NAD(P)-dependent dehydrogenase (short-subunit alcohol dehydrogenase family)
VGARSQARWRRGRTTLAWAFGAFLGNVLYDTAKAATARLAYGTAQQLRDYRVAIVALALGHLGVTETTEYLGRGIATLAADPHILTKTGELLTVGQLAREYGFIDLDGTQPEPWGLPSARRRWRNEMRQRRQQHDHRP